MTFDSMAISVDELAAGPVLDSMVSVALGGPVRPYSTSWPDAGNVMREHRIGVSPCGFRSKDVAWLASTIAPAGKPCFSVDDDPIVAVMRCLLLSKGQATAAMPQSLN